MSSTETENNWKCPSCGAMNEDFRKFCDGCGDKRPGAAVTTKGIAMDEILGSSSESSSEESTEFEEAKPKSKPKKAKKEKKSKKKAEEDEETAEPERLNHRFPSQKPSRHQPQSQATISNQRSLLVIRSRSLPSC